MMKVKLMGMKETMGVRGKMEMNKGEPRSGNKSVTLFPANTAYTHISINQHTVDATIIERNSTSGIWIVGVSCSVW